MATQATAPELESKALALVDYARSLQITNQPSYDQVTNALLDVKGARKAIAAHHDPTIADTNKAHKTALAAKERFDRPLKEVEVILKLGIRTWDNEQERLRLEAQRRADEEAQRQNEEARLQQGIAAEQNGASEADVQAIVEAPSAAPPPVVAPTYQKRQGVSVRENWKAEVVNLDLLVQAVAQHKAPLNCLQANQVALNQLARAQKQALSIPGVRAVNDAVVSARK